MRETTERKKRPTPRKDKKDERRIQKKKKQDKTEQRPRRKPKENNEARRGEERETNFAKHVVSATQKPRYFKAAPART